MVKINQDYIKSWFILVPPLNEQAEIISHLKQKENDVFCLENQIRTEIERLNELKAIFVSHVITGKIKV